MSLNPPPPPRPRLTVRCSWLKPCSHAGSLTAYAFRTNPKHELTQLGAGLYSAGNALGMFCLMKLFFFRGHRASDLALSCLATLFFSLYLVYDTYRRERLGGAYYACHDFRRFRSREVRERRGDWCLRVVLWVFTCAQIRFATFAELSKK